MMDSPTGNLILFLIVAAFAAILLWPRLGFIQAIRGRLRMNQRTQLEDALKYIYNSKLNNEPVSVQVLSNALNIVASKSAELTDHMTRVGLISHAEGRILLTEEGELYAVQIIRAHRLWERYLADETGVDPKEWHTQAEQIEHKMSPEEANSLAKRLGNPLFDPHGDPIPTAEGEYIAPKLQNLRELPIGKCARIMHLEDEPEDVYEQIVNLGIYPGMEMRLQKMSGDDYVVEADGSIFQITTEAAANLSIKLIEKIAPVDDKTPRESLDALQVGEMAKITQISPVCRGFERRRLMDLGIVPSTEIRFYKHGLTGGLRAYNVRGTVLALRDEQIKMISISDRRKIGA